LSCLDEATIVDGLFFFFGLGLPSRYGLNSWSVMAHAFFGAFFRSCLQKPGAVVGIVAGASHGVTA